MKLLCKLGFHEVGRPKQWVVDGKTKTGCYCKRCGKFVEEEKK